MGKALEGIDQLGARAPKLVSMGESESLQDPFAKPRDMHQRLPAIVRRSQAMHDVTAFEPADEFDHAVVPQDQSFGQPPDRRCLLCRSNGEKELVLLGVQPSRARVFFGECQE
jgi:hypothetical protein